MFPQNGTTRFFSLCGIQERQMILMMIRKYLHTLFCISFKSLIALKSGTGATEHRFDRHANFLEHVGTEEATAGVGGWAGHRTSRTRDLTRGHRAHPAGAAGPDEPSQQPGSHYFHWDHSDTFCLLEVTPGRADGAVSVSSPSWATFRAPGRSRRPQ